MSTGLYSAGSRPQAQGGTCLYQQPQCCSQLEGKNQQWERHKISHWIWMLSSLCSTVITWLTIQSTEKLGTLLTLGGVQGIVFHSQKPEKDHFCSWTLVWPLRGDLPQGCHGHPRALALQGKSCWWNDTYGLPDDVQDEGNQAPCCAHLAWDSICFSASKPWSPCPCPPHPYICPPRLQWTWARLLNHHTSSNSYAGQNGFAPPVKSVCFISASIFSLLVHGGEERGGNHLAVGLAGGLQNFSRSGSSSQLPHDAKENNTHESAPARLNIGSLSGSTLSLHP